MSLIKIISASLLAVGIVGVSSLAQAGNLTLINNTNEDSTVSISMCSSYLPGGVTKAHTKNVIPDSTVKIACTGQSTNCKAAVYMTSNCTGPIVANAVFDVNFGLKSLTMVSTKYQVNGKGFILSMDYAPQAK